MSKQKRSRQSWWRLYAVALLMIGLLILAHYLAPSPGWRTFLEVGVVGVGYGLITWWVETNHSVLLERPSRGVNRHEIKLPELETPSPLPPHVPCQFYTDSNLLITYGETCHSNGDMHLNGHHHLAQTTTTSEETIE